MLATILFLAGIASAADPHIKVNPLYSELREKGIAVSSQTRTQLPPPEMPDGISAEEQRKLLEKLLGNDFDYDVFTEKTVNAPVFLMPLQTIEKADPAAPAHQMNLYFIVHGNIGKLNNRKTLEEIAGTDKDKGEGKELTADELKERKITIAPDNAKKEAYGYAVLNILDRVKLEVTGHSYISELSDSTIIAGEVSPAFNKDSRYPNQWQPIKGGQAPQPYYGSGYYLKLTPLKGIPGASFVECHMVFTEPVGWFDGANLLRSKLPAAMTTMVRKFRQQLNR